MKSEHYILEGKVIKEATLMEWAQWMETPGVRRVDKTTYGDVEVSTVFLGLDHRFVDEGEPILFETMIFGGELDEETDRCCTYAEAETMHKQMCEKVLTL